MTQPQTAIGDVERFSKAELEAEIRRHNKLYWEEQAPDPFPRAELEAEFRGQKKLYGEEQPPEISDYDYDRLVVRLKALAPDSPALVELGESAERLGDPVQHQSPMLSLDKCYGEADL